MNMTGEVDILTCNNSGMMEVHVNGKRVFFGDSYDFEFPESLKDVLERLDLGVVVTCGRLMDEY